MKACTTLMTVLSSVGWHAMLSSFMNRRGLSNREAALLFGVEAHTIRRYLAPPDAKMARKTNAVVLSMIRYIDKKCVPVDVERLGRVGKLTNAQFDTAIGARDDAAAARIFGCDPTTVFRWRRSLDVPLTVAKFVHLLNAHGWPIAPAPPILVDAEWDGAARVWAATSKSVDGLAVEADTLEELEPKVTAALRDLIESNGIDGDQPEIPVHITARKATTVRRHLISPA